MNSIEAKNLLSLLKAQVSPEEMATDCFFQELISEHFVSTLLTGKVVSRHSLRGRVAYILKSDSKLFSEREVVKETFARAIVTLWKDKEENKLFQQDFYKKLRSEFERSKLLEKVDQLDNTPFSTTELEALTAIKQAKLRKQRAELWEKSLFHKPNAAELQPTGIFQNIRTSVLKSLFEPASTSPKKTQRLFHHFLETCPSFVSGNFLERKHLATQALESDRLLQGEMIKNFRPLDPKLRENAIRSKAVEMEKTVQDLRAGQRWMCAGSFGAKVDSIESLLRQFRKLPTVASNKIPAPIQSVINSDIILPYPKEIITQTLQPYLDRLMESIPGLDAQPSGAIEGLLNILLYDKDKKLPEGVSQKLPEVVTNELNTLLQNGVFGCLVDFYQPGPTRDLLEWICLNSDMIKDVDKRKDFVDELEKKINHFTQGIVGDPKGMIDRSIEGVMDQVQQLIPDSLQTLLGLDAHLHKGQIWLEIERLNNGTCTVYIYGSGDALKFHPHNSKGEVKWPLKIEGVVYSKINANFFQRFLFHHIEPTYDHNVLSSAEHLYKGLFAYLRPDTSVSQNDAQKEEWMKKPSNVSTTDDMLQQLLINPQYTLEQVQFEFRLQAFLDYTRPLFKPEDGLFHIKDDSIAETLTLAYQKLLQELEIHKLEMKEERYEMLKATLTEVKDAVFTYYSNKEEADNTLEEKDFALPDSITEPIKQFGLATGFTSTYMASMKEVLCQVFGEKIRPLVNVLVKALPVPGSEVTVKQKQDVDDPKIWTQKSRLIQFMTGYFFQTAMVATRILLHIISFFQSSLSFLGLIFGVKYILDNYIPHQYLTWYHSVMSKARHAIFHTILKIIISCLISPQHWNNLHKYLDNYLDSIEIAGKKLSTEHTISYAVQENNAQNALKIVLESEPNSGKLNKNLFSNIGVNAHTLKLPIPATVEKIHPHSLKEELESWLKLITPIQGFFSSQLAAQQYLFILAQVRRLPIPTRGKDDFWDQVNEPAECQKLLATIRDHLGQHIAINERRLDSLKYNAQETISSYKLFTAIHALAHRALDGDLPKQSLDVTHLLYWIKDHPYLASLEIHRDLKAILQYMRPESEFDLSNLPSKNEMKALAKSSLFNYTQYKMTMIDDIFHLPSEMVRFPVELAIAIRKPFINNSKIVSEPVFKGNKSSPLWPLWYARDAINYTLGSFVRDHQHAFNVDKLSPEDAMKSLKYWIEREPCPAFGQMNSLMQPFHFRMRYQSLFALDLQDTSRLKCMSNEEAFQLVDKVTQELISMEVKGYPIPTKNGYSSDSQLAPMNHLHTLALYKASALLHYFQSKIDNKTASLDIDIEPLTNALEDHFDLQENTMPEVWLHFDELHKYYVNVDKKYAYDSEKIDLKRERIIDKFEIEPESTIDQAVSYTIDVAHFQNPEFQYLAKKLEEPGVDKKLAKRGVKKELAQLYKLPIMFYDSFFEDCEVLPEPYLILRQQAIKIPHASVLKNNESNKSTNRKYKTHLYQDMLHRVDRYLTSTLGKTEMYLPNHCTTVLNDGHLRGSSLCNSTPFKLFNLFYRNKRSQIAIEESPGGPYFDAYQNSIIPNETQKYHENKKVFDELELLLNQPQDRIVRLLGYFKEYPGYLTIAPHSWLKSPSSDDFGFSLILEFALFSPGLLEKQLKDSPHIVPALSDFIERTFQHFKEKKDLKTALWVLRLGMMLKQYCMAYDEKYKKAFPDLLGYYHSLANLANTKEEKADYELYHAHLLDPNYHNFSNEALEHEAIELCHNITNLPWFDSQGITPELTYTTQERFSQWLPAIQMLLENDTFRTKMMLSLCQRNGIVLSSKKYNQWTKLGEWQYYCHDMMVDLLFGFANEKSNTVTLAFFEAIPEIREVLGEDVKKLEKTKKNKWKTADGKYTILLEPKRIDCQYTIYKKSSGKRYQMIAADSEKWKVFFQQAGIVIPPHAHVWVEDTNNPNKLLKIECTQEGMEKEIILKLSQNKKDPLEYHLQSILVDDEESVPITLAHSKHEMHLLSKFCSLANISAWKSPNEDFIKQFSFTPYDLSFRIEDRQGKRKAYSQDKYPGFAIANNQFHPNLRGYASYLLLETDNGNKKVLIPDGQWLSSTAWRGLQKVGPLANFASEYLQHIDQRFVQKLYELLGTTKAPSKYYEYHLDDKGELWSDDPEAMSYLTMLNLMQGKAQAASKACERLEKLAKRMPLPTSIHTMFMPLTLVPFEVEELRYMRMRIFSVLEENRLVHKTEMQIPSENESTWLENSSDIMKGLVTLLDLHHIIKNPEANKKLSDAQEWFLFRIVFRTYKQLIQQGANSGNASSSFAEVYQFMKEYGADPIIEAIGLLPHLSARYRALKKKLQLKDHKVLALIQAGKTVWDAPSLLPENFSLANFVNKKTSEFINDKTTGMAQTGALPVLPQLWKLGCDIWHNRLLDFKILNFKHLAETIVSETNNPPMDVQSLTSAEFTKYFASYYAIAMGDIHPSIRDEKQRELKEMLALLKGGWDQQSALLINYLEAVHATYLEKTLKLYRWETTVNVPKILFPNSNELKQILKINDSKSEETELASFFNTLHNRSLWIHSIQQSDSAAKNMAAGLGYTPHTEKTIKQYIPIVKDLPISGIAEQLVNLLGKGAKVVKDMLTCTAEPTQVIESAFPLLEDINIEDNAINDTLEGVFTQLFAEESPPEAWKEQVMKTLKVPEKADAVLKDRIERVNQSIGDFYSKQKIPNILLYRGAEKLWEAFVQLEDTRESYRRRIEKDRSEVLNCINSQIKEGEKVTLQQIDRCILKEDYASLVAAFKLQPDEAAIVTRILIFCKVRETRLQQMSRICNTMDQLMQLKPENDAKLIEEKLEQLAEELKARRHYINKEKPISNRLLLRYLMFETKSNKMIWERQVESIDKLLPEEITDAVIELIMSMGKTSTIIPIYDALEADGTKAVFNIFPHPIAETNIKTASDQAFYIFDQIVHGLMFTRGIPLSSDELQALQVVMQCTVNGDIAAMTKEDAQALELILEDRLYRYQMLSAHQKVLEEPALDALRNILKIMRKGKGVADEAHDIFDCYQELNYPLGKRSTIKNSYYRIVERCMRYIATDPRLETYISENNLPRVSVDDFMQKIVPDIAMKMVDYPLFEMQKKTPQQRQEFIDFVTGNSKTVPEWIKDPNFPHYSEISMVKGVLTVLMKNALQRLVSVNYDAALNKDKGEYARPADGNNNVKDEACIRTPYEALVKTFLMLYSKGLDQSQCLALIEALQTKAENSAKVQHKSVEETLVYQNFKPLVSSIDIFKTTTFSPQQMEEIVTKFGQNQEATELYIRYFIAKQIPYWKLNLRSNSQNFASQFGTIVSDTGTPYNYGTFPEKCQMLWDPGTVGEALHIIKKKCPENGIHVLDADQPKTILDEILKKFFSFDSDFTAIIDGGALFKGVSNEFVARQMLAHAQINLPHIRAVKFFKKNAQGRDELVWIEKGASEATAVDESRIPEEFCLTYYDQPHAFASDIKQKTKAKGLELVGEQEHDQTLHRYLQDVFRMRGLKKKKIIKTSNSDEGTQTIQFAMTKSARNKITQQETPSFEELVMYGIRNEATRAKEDNYISQLQKIHNVIRRAVLDKILEAKNAKEAAQIFKEFEKVLISILEDDPKKLYGLIEQQVLYTEALECAAKAAMKHIEKSSRFDKDEQGKIQSQLNKLAKPDPNMMPEKVTVFTDGHEILTNVLDDLEKQTQVQQTTDVEIENESENEQELENEQEQNLRNRMSFLGNWRSEKEWPTDIDFNEKQWMQITKLKDFFAETWKAAFQRWVMIITCPDTLPFPLFYIYDLLENAMAEPLRQVAYAFDKRLWCSNNFIPKQVKAIQSPVEIGSNEQFRMYEVLIHLREIDDGSYVIDQMAPLSVKEANSWRNMLSNQSPKDKQKKEKVIVYDLKNRIAVAGSSTKVKKLRQNEDLMKMEVMLHFINGNVNYEACHIPILKAWLKDNNPQAMKDAFHVIHTNHKRDVFDGSNIDIIFNELLNIPWTEQL